VYALIVVSLAYYDGVRGVDIPYFLSATATTVGFGDISCRSQLTRGLYVVLLPFGMSILGGIRTTYDYLWNLFFSTATMHSFLFFRTFGCDHEDASQIHLQSPYGSTEEREVR